MAASSSAVKSVRLAAARFSSSWATLLAPMSAEVTRESRSTQEMRELGQRLAARPGDLVQRADVRQRLRG